jgi:hypothetical protein
VSARKSAARPRSSGDGRSRERQEPRSGPEVELRQGRVSENQQRFPKDSGNPGGDRSSTVATPLAPEKPLRSNSDGPRHQRWCSAEVPAGAERCPRCGVVQPRNALARQHGAYAAEPEPEVQALAERLTAGIVADLGGPAELSEIERGYVRKIAVLEGTLHVFAKDMKHRGLLTRSGGVRRVYEQFLHGLDRWDRLAQRLGTRRRARPVETAADIIAAHRRSEPSA